MIDDAEPGRPAVAAVFAAFVLTAVGGVVLVHGLAAVLPPASPGAPPPAAPLTLTILFVSLAFAVAQAILPGPRSSGCFGLAIPMAGAVALAARGVEPASVVSALFVGTFITPAAYYLAIRLSFALAGFLRRHPLAAVFMAAAGMLLVVETARAVTYLADRSTGGRFW